MSAQPWQQLPATVAAVIRPLLPELVDEIIEAVGEVPAYRRPLEGEFGVGVRAGVEQALGHMVREIEAAGPVPRPDVYRRLGRGEMRSGRSLDALLSAYRAGARVTWRRLALAGEAQGLEPSTMYLLAESIFAYIDMLSAESAEGYALEQTAQAGAAELARGRLTRLLVRDPPAEPAELRTAARNAGWQLPRALAALAVAAQSVAGLGLGPEIVSATVQDVVCVIVPDPDAPRRRAQIERAMRTAGLRAGLGPTVAPGRGAVSFARARAALKLAGPQEHLVSAQERAGEIMLAADPVLAAEFAAAQLAPLDAVSPGARERLVQTLRAWLDEQGRLAPTARRLGVHPQTARYRLTRLRDLLGETLEDPDRRFWLQLALRSQAAADTNPRGGAS